MRFEQWNDVYCLSVMHKNVNFCIRTDYNEKVVAPGFPPFDF